MYTRFINYAVAAAAVAAIAGSGVRTSGQAAMQPTNDAPNPYMSHGSSSSYLKGARGDRRARSISIRTASRSGSPSAAAQNSCLDRATRPDVDLRSDSALRRQRQAGQELRRGHAHLPARHPCRPRRQHLGDRRPGQRAAPARGAGAGGAAAAGAQRRASAVRAAAPAGPIGPPAGATKGNQVSSSAPTANCC